MSVDYYDDGEMVREERLGEREMILFLYFFASLSCR